MKLSLLLSFILSLAFLAADPSRAISFSNLAVDERIEVDWQGQACFGSERYKLTFHCDPQPEVSVERRVLPGQVNLQKTFVPIAQDELRELDEELLRSRKAGAPKIFDCDVAEQMTLTLYKDNKVQSREAVTACSPTKFHLLITSVASNGIFQKPS